jgi:type I restriction enzyme M protein
MNNEIPFLLKEDRLLKRFEDIHNFIYANDGLSPQQVLDEIIKILFIKLVDENNKNSKFFIAEKEYKEIKDKHKNIDFANRITDLFEQMKKYYNDIFENDERLNLSNPSLAFTISLLQNINLSESSNDVKGLAFQKFLASQQKGDRGQYFTPEPVIELCVKMISPKSNETIIDPACGSGGFLYSALKYYINKNKISRKDEYVENNLFGIDINKRIAKIAKMKLLLETNSKCSINISCFNTLEEFDYKKINNNNLTANFDIVLTNPPFGTVGKITSLKVLGNYALGHRWIQLNEKYIPSSNILQGQAPEILFIEACTRLLKQGGRMAIILPNGHLENPTLNYLRYYLKNNFKIYALIKLPPETFIPYGTGVKTSVLFLKKKNQM